MTMFDSKMSGANQVHSTNGKTWNISNIFLLSSHTQIMLYVGHHELIILIICNPYTARSAEVEPPGLGSKCGKQVERLSDF